MRLKSVYIGEYKNLKNFELKFDGDSFIDVFVGKNGSGKSNFFEALIEIFKFLYEKKAGADKSPFDFKVAYEIEGVCTEIVWENDALLVDGKERKTIGSTSLPDNILVYYSGHNAKVSNVIQIYERNFKRGIKSADVDVLRKFIFVGADYKQLLLLTILLQSDNSVVRTHVCNKLGIAALDEVLKISLKRPYFDKGKKNNVDVGDSNTRYWGVTGTLRELLDRLVDCGLDDGQVRDEGYLQKLDQYALYLDVTKIRHAFKNESAKRLFSWWDMLKLLEMIESIDLSIQLVDGSKGDISRFSDGQFQSVYIYSIIEIFKDSNCLTLMDEPDSFLHPEWQFGFLKQIIDISHADTEKNHVLLSSHSAVTLIPHQRDKIRFFDIKNNYANCYELPKRIAIQKLSSDLIKYSEEEQLLSILNAIQIEKKPVMFTEGSTDPVIIKEAWYKLYDEACPFIPFYAFSCTYIKQLLTDNRIHAEMGGLPLFALFDFDKAYDQWNGLNGTVLNENPFDGMAKKWNDGESYAIMLPVPRIPEIMRQVIKNEQEWMTFGGESKCEIEHLFYGLPETLEYFSEEPCSGGCYIKFNSDRDKVHFAKNIVKTLAADRFELFRPMFEFIKSKCRTITTP